MPDKKSYPLRINADVLAAMKAWAADDLRSLNGQIEWALREALRGQGRLKNQTEKGQTEKGEKNE